MKFFQVTLVIFSLAFPFITGCSNSSMENVVSKNLSFDLLEYFNGETTAWGLIVDRFGNLQRTFKVRLNGNIDNKQLLLKEYFTYNDGETEYREWIITKTETGTYEGKSKDTIGVAEGKQDRNTMRMVYDTKISIGETDIRVSFDDRFIKNLFEKEPLMKQPHKNPNFKPLIITNIIFLVFFVIVVVSGL